MTADETIQNEYVTGLEFRLDRLKTLKRAWQIARTSYPSRKDAFRAFRGLVRTARQNQAIRHIAKGVRVNGRVYTLMGLPGRPSAAMDRVIKEELNRCLPIPGFRRGLMVLLFAITKKCPLRCEHCFEWDALNQPEHLSPEDILTVVRNFQELGVAQIELSGGEPLLRLPVILEVLRQSNTRDTDFWLLTSGYHLTAEKAQQLQSAGLRGVSVSLDHWSEPEHDRFRGLQGSYDWAIKAARHARDAGLLVSLSLVPTRSFCTAENLWRYADLARELQVHFIRLLEPKAAGHYAGLPVELTEKELAVCERFVRDIQRTPAGRGYPLVEYHATYQRIVGCGGAGRRYLYIDTDGDLHVCPFCRKKAGSALKMNALECLQTLEQTNGCPAFSLIGAHNTLLSATP